MKKLIMWSGGIDSTYVLARVLKESDDEIFAHHIHLINLERRNQAEMGAIAKLIPKLHKIRPFRYTDSVVDHSRLPGFPYDMPIVCFEAGVAMKAWRMRNVIMDEWGIGTHEAEGHWQKRWDAIIPATKAAYWDDIERFYEPPPFRLHKLVSKKEEMTYLQELGLLEDCWFCRTPREGQNCGDCKSCAEVKLAMQ